MQSNQPSLINRAAGIMAAPLPRLAFLWANCFSWMNNVVIVIAIMSTISTLYVAYRLFKNRQALTNHPAGNALERWFKFIMKNI